MPSPVDKYFKQVKQDNPSYSDEQAWATAWSIYCKYKNPGSGHCKKDPSEYLKKAREVRRPTEDFLRKAEGGMAPPSSVLAALPESSMEMRVASRYRGGEGG